MILDGGSAGSAGAGAGAGGGPDKTRLLVVGNGMTTDRLLDELEVRCLLETLEVTVVGEEPYGAYNRILLSKVLAGADPDVVITKAPEWYASAGVRLISGRRVQHIDTTARSAHLGNDETVEYDIAVLATGSSARMPPVAGITDEAGERTKGVHVLRSLEDSLGIRSAVRPGSPAIVVGGGLLGLEAAKAMNDAGAQVRVVHPVEHLLEAQLDETAGLILRKEVEAMGIEVVVGLSTAVLSSDSGVDALLLDSGEIVPAENVVFTTGVRPRIDLASNSGIEVNVGVIVDDRLATSTPGVYAIGECAEHRDTLFGLVAPCWDHAAVLAGVLAGEEHARYDGTATYTRLKVAGIEVASLGSIHPEPGDDVVETLQRSRGIYRKLIVRDGLLVGAVLIGDGSSPAGLIRLAERSEPVPDNVLDLFCSPAAFAGLAAEVDTVCNCNRVTEDQITAAIAGGNDSVELVGQATRAGTGCGTCVSSIRRLLESVSASAAA